MKEKGGYRRGKNTPGTGTSNLRRQIVSMRNSVREKIERRDQLQVEIDQIEEALKALVHGVELLEGKKMHAKGGCDHCGRLHRTEDIARACAARHNAAKCPRCDTTLAAPRKGELPKCRICGWEDYQSAEAVKGGVHMRSE